MADCVGSHAIGRDSRRSVHTKRFDRPDAGTVKSLARRRACGNAAALRPAIDTSATGPRGGTARRTCGFRGKRTPIAATGAGSVEGVSRSVRSPNWPSAHHRRAKRVPIKSWTYWSRSPAPECYRNIAASQKHAPARSPSSSRAVDGTMMMSSAHRGGSCTG